MTVDQLDSLPVRWILDESFACTVHGSIDPGELYAKAWNDGMYHRAGGPSPLYMAESKRIALIEWLRQFEGDVTTSLVSQTMAHLGIVLVCDLPVLDLTDENVRRRLDVTEEQLRKDRRTCQVIASRLRADPKANTRFGGILAPAVLPGAQILVVFYEWIENHVEFPERGAPASDLTTEDRAVALEIVADTRRRRLARRLTTPAAVAAIGAVTAVCGLIAAVARAVG